MDWWLHQFTYFGFFTSVLWLEIDLLRTLYICSTCSQTLSLLKCDRNQSIKLPIPVNRLMVLSSCPMTLCAKLIWIKPNWKWDLKSSRRFWRSDAVQIFAEKWNEFSSLLVQIFEYTSTIRREFPVLLSTCYWSKYTSVIKRFRYLEGESKKANDEELSVEITSLFLARLKSDKKHTKIMTEKLCRAVQKTNEWHLRVPFSWGVNTAKKRNGKFNLW